MALQNSQIVKGSQLQLWLGDDTQPVAFATEHSLSINVETTEISSKDHGDYAASLPQRISWSVSASNLYSDDGEETLYNYMNDMSPITIKFAKVSNYASYGDKAEKGIVANADGTQPVSGKESWTMGTVIAQGDAIITSLEINASAGDNATMSIQLQGVGALNEIESDGPTGVTGV